jgi:hypothetical protein
VGTNEIDIYSMIYVKMYPRVPVVNILGSHKCSLLLDVPQTWFSNWPVDDYESKHVATLIDNKLVVF